MLLKRLNFGKKHKVMAEINVVPYIDVMLVLLVIFMITAPLLTQGVKVNLPVAAAKALSPEKREPLVVSIDANGNYFLNIASNPNAAITPNDLFNVVSSQLKGEARSFSNQRQILVKGDSQVPYGKVVAAMVLLQQAGAEKVGLITIPPAQNSH